MIQYDRFGNLAKPMTDDELQDFLDEYYWGVLVPCKHCGRALVPKSVSMWYCPTCEEMNYFSDQITIDKI